MVSAAPPAAAKSTRGVSEKKEATLLSKEKEGLFSKS